MRRWFEWMSQHQDDGDKKTEFVWKNLHQETESIRHWLSKGDWEYWFDGPAFDGKKYIKTISTDYEKFGIDLATISEWIDDPEYDRLMKQTGTMSIIAIPGMLRKIFVQQVRDIFPIDWDTAQIDIMAQRPGEMFPLHYDRFKNQEFDLAIEQEQEIQRWVIMLDDQQPGQCFFMNDKNIEWKSGDVISWNQTNFSHGSANFGYHTRLSVRITAHLVKNTNGN